MKIHEKDPNSATAAAPPSPLKRRRLSSKRKLSHDAESEKEDPAPAKKKWQLCDGREVLANAIVGIILQYTNISNQHTVP